MVTPAELLIDGAAVPGRRGVAPPPSAAGWGVCVVLGSVGW